MFRPTDLPHWFGDGTRDRERDETRARWNEVERLWRASPLATTPADDLSVTVMKSVFRICGRLPALPVIVATAHAVETLLRAEDIIALEADWPVIDGDAAVAVEIANCSCAADAGPPILSGCSAWSTDGSRNA